MTSQNSDSSDISLNFDTLNLSDCTGGRRRRIKYPPRLVLSANNFFNSFPHSDESSTTYLNSVSNAGKKKARKTTGLVQRLPSMGIFWDIENVPVPKMKSPAAVVQRIREVFLEDYRESEFVVVCDVKREAPHIIQDLHDSQVNLIHVASTSKNAADEKLRQFLRRFAELHPAPSAVVLISGDINFASDLFDLRYCKKIRVILVHNVNVANALISCANEHHSFTTLTQNLPLNYSQKAGEVNTYFFLTIVNLPKHIDKGKVRNRLQYLTNNCGGKCAEFVAEEGIACFRFGNFDLALRAQKRIQGEDLFGQKIKVLAPSVRSYSGQKVKGDVREAFQQQPQRAGSYQHQYGSSAPPPGFENRQINAYTYPSSNRKLLQDNSLSIAAAAKFRPIGKMGLSPSFGSGQNVSPMEISTEQYQNSFVNRRTPSSSRQSTPQDQLNLGASALHLPYGRIRGTSGSSEFSDSDGKGYISSESGSKPQVNQPTELNITNLDPTMQIKELRRLLMNMIKEYAMVLSLNVVLQPDGTPVANLKVGSQQEAQLIISHLHRQKLGHKRISIAYEENNSPTPEQLKVMVISILQDAPDKRMPLFKFMELLESRYLCTVSVSEVNKLKDVVRIKDERGSRAISLTADAIRMSPVNSTLPQAMVPHCVIHCPKNMQNIGWCELNSPIIPNVIVSLSMFATKLMTLLNIHFGSMPLLSFQTCYEQVFQEHLPVHNSGVPLEHLITCIPNVEIKLVGPNKSIKVIQHEVKPIEENADEQVLKSVALPLAPNVNLLCREVVDLLKNMDKCQILLTKFIPAYHHHFGRQCRVADYGYTRLLDLLESISHVVQIMGDSYRRIITLTHSAQVRRFTSDLLRVLKVQPNKQIAVYEFASAYEKALNKPFNPVEYGLCSLEDLLCEIPENTVAITRDEEGVFICVPKREQTADEVARTKQFAKEVIDLLRHTSNSTMLFNKFVPSYHHHFGHQCKVSDYGFAKLIELFEAIPDIVEIKELPDGERIVSLTLEQSLKILSSQVLQVIRNAGNCNLTLNDLPVLYMKEFGYPLNLEGYQCQTLEELVDKMSEYAEVVHSNAGSLLRTVEMDTSPNILRVRCWALLLCPPHVKDLNSFRYEYRQCYNNNFTIESLRSISNIISLSTMNNTDFISLTSLYVLAAQLYFVICAHNGSLEFNQLECLYEEYYSKPLKLSSFNINTVNEFYNKFNLMFYVKGSKKKSVVVLSRNLQEHIAFKCADNLEAEDQWLMPSVAEGGLGMVKKYSPPKPDTPPSPSSAVWWGSPAKFGEPAVNFSINMPITIDHTLLGQSENLISPAKQLMAIENSPWPMSTQVLAPEPHELPLPNKLIPKAGADDSGDSGVNIMLDNSPSDNELESFSSRARNTGAIRKKPLYGTFLNFK
ncbi:meiosis regulator and mRNA stability factor 1 isoform X1 [Euwallacea fornicatus]|uniref:meiosis regulator and mRNA stability factor 1 isoform X1 n=1 Tax=Euwallacea fornicatus TaxID=995702 RepID=UPI00338F7951